MRNKALKGVELGNKYKVVDGIIGRREHNIIAGIIQGPRGAIYVVEGDCFYHICAMCNVIFQNYGKGTVCVASNGDKVLLQGRYNYELMIKNGKAKKIDSKNFKELLENIITARKNLLQLDNGYIQDVKIVVKQNIPVIAMMKVVVYGKEQVYTGESAYNFLIENGVVTSYDRKAYYLRKNNGLAKYEYA